MATVLDLDTVGVVPGPTAGGANTHSWLLLDGGDRPVGRVVERRGSLFGTLRRQLSSADYRLPTTYDVVDPDGTVQLVLHRAPVNRLKTKLAVVVTLGDESELATVTDTSTLTDVGRFDATDATGAPVAELVRVEATSWRVTAPDGRPMGEIGYRPVTRSLVRPDGRDTDRYDLRPGPGSSTAVRAAMLGAVIVQGSLRHR